jgi:uncharacterized protein (TIGR00297 family)
MLSSIVINPLQLVLGVLLAAAISIAAYRVRSLSRSGAMAATLLGIVVFGLGGLAWAVLLMAFFVSSSALSRLFGKRKRDLNEKFSKGSQRDAAQVAANGGVSGIFVLLHLLYPQAAWPWLAFAGTLAAVNADTWATELGVLSPVLPRLITTGKPVERGSSGGITLAGTLASLTGAALIAVLGALLRPADLFPVLGAQIPLIIFLISLAGLAGSLLDSLLGATVQAKRPNAIQFTCAAAQPSCCAVGPG